MVKGGLAPMDPSSRKLEDPFNARFLADALATGVAVGGDEALAGLPGYAGYLIRSNGSEADTGGIDFVR